ncbi:galactose-specific lectin nattectin-like isoform X2 [Xyrichtys novacula]|uniref:Galactose-specific lectin nattectin-like isoform X2 n=1 Tax=Xyrichtys novacula TaxID=13765 RepID=A0AAV1HI71_XYRNO|nr:galactose-specific lectin nattectin-like isoform X2 [Xyrichtys novacula]
MLSFQVIFFLGLSSGLFTGAIAMPVQQDEPAPACPPGWTQLESRCFIFYRMPKSWTEAESVCIKIGGNLASIHNSEENLFLNRLTERVTGHAGLHTWIGGHDAVKEGKWMWSDGTKFDYLRWGPGEPNNSGTEHCIEMNSAGTFWNDSKCQSLKPFVCAKDVDVTA